MTWLSVNHSPSWACSVAQAWQATEGPDLCCLVADKTAQAEYDRVATALGPLQDLLGGISYATVGGTESRAELRHAADLLEKVAAILTKTSSREARWYDLLERLAPRQILGEHERHDIGSHRADF